MKKTMGARLAALVLSLACAACSSVPLPPCPVAKIHRIDTPHGPVFFVDFDNLEAMRLRMVGLEERTCEPGEVFGTDADADEAL